MGDVIQFRGRDQLTNVQKDILNELKMEDLKNSIEKRVDEPCLFAVIDGSPRFAYVNVIQEVSDGLSLHEFEHPDELFRLMATIIMDSINEPD